LQQVTSVAGNGFDVIRFITKMPMGNCALAPKEYMRTVRSLKRGILCRLEIILEIGWKTITPLPNWPQQSTFQTWRHNHFNVYTVQDPQARRHLSRDCWSLRCEFRGQ